MTKLVTLIGIPASGKSTFAQKLAEQTKAVVVERDVFRERYYKEGKVWSNELETEVKKQRNNTIAALLKDGTSVISSDTNISPKTRRQLQAIAKECGAEYEEHVIWCKLDVAKKRNIQRQGWKVVPEDIMHRMYINFVEQFPIKYKPDTSKPKAYMIDIDGTLAKKVSDRSHYDWTRVAEDEPHHDVMDLVNTLWLCNYYIIIMSGRPEESRGLTIEWFKKHAFEFDKMFMRPNNYNLKDSVVKHDLFHQYVAPYYNVLGVIDDRDQVVKMWRSMGLRCYQVDYGDY